MYTFTLSEAEHALAADVAVLISRVRGGGKAAPAASKTAAPSAAAPAASPGPAPSPATPPAPAAAAPAPAAPASPPPPAGPAAYPVGGTVAPYQPAAPAAPAPAPAAPAAQGGATVDVVRNLLAEVANKAGALKAREVMTELGVTNVKFLTPEQLPTAAAKLRAALAA